MLEIYGLEKTYPGGKKAVDNVNIKINDGEIFGFIGHNGAGKTTTIKCVVGILTFDKGEIYVNSHNVKTESLLCKQITAYIPDNPDLYEMLTGIQYLNFIHDTYCEETRVLNRLMVRTEENWYYMVFDPLKTLFSFQNFQTSF